MPFTDRTDFVKYHTYLSPDGWVYMIEHYNKILRKIAHNEKVHLIELEPTLTGKPKYFRDFVHFNKQGHIKVASIIGKKLSRLVKNKGKF